MDRWKSSLLPVLIFFSSVFEANELGSGVSRLLSSNGVSTHHKSMIYITIQREMPLHASTI